MLEGKSKDFPDSTVPSDAVSCDFCCRRKDSAIVQQYVSRVEAIKDGRGKAFAPFKAPSPITPPFEEPFIPISWSPCRCLSHRHQSEETDLLVITAFGTGIRDAQLTSSHVSKCLLSSLVYNPIKLRACTETLLQLVEPPVSILNALLCCYDMYVQLIENPKMSALAAASRKRARIDTLPIALPEPPRQNAIVFKSPGLAPDVEILVFDQPFHVHSMILNLHSN
jgi:hypothetical protein